MNKFMWVLLVIMLCVGCVPGPDSNNEINPTEDIHVGISRVNIGATVFVVWGNSNTYTEIYRFVDNQAGVVCYIAVYDDSIDCLPVSDTRLDK